jgi:hypothetical protein
MPSTARQTLNALQFSDDLERINGLEQMDFKSHSVKLALATKERRSIEHKSNKVLDPYLNLPTNVLSETYTRRVLTLFTPSCGIT